MSVSGHVIPAELRCIPRLVSPTTAAKILDVSRQTVMRLVERGDLDAVRVSTLWKIRRDSLMKLIGGDAGEEGGDA